MGEAGHTGGLVQLVDLLFEEPYTQHLAVHLHPAVALGGGRRVLRGVVLAAPRVCLCLCPCLRLCLRHTYLCCSGSFWLARRARRVGATYCAMPANVASTRCTMKKS